MNRAATFSIIRGSKLYGGYLPQSAVVALDLFLDATDGNGFPEEHVAYMMATAYHEVGATLVPRRESLNYSVAGLLATFGRHRIMDAEAKRLGRQPGEKSVPLVRQKQIANIVYGGEWGRKNLGNTQPNDGWDFRGGGFPQATGRANFAKLEKLTGVPLVTQPDRIVEPAVAVVATVEAMTVGLYTGKKLADYKLPEQFPQARAIINADVAKNGETIAGYARIFLTALKAGSYEPRKVIKGDSTVAAPKPEPVKVEPSPAQGSAGGWGVGAGVLAVAAGALAAGWHWLASLPCEYLNLFCGN